MNNDLISIIEENNLSIRKLPEQVIGLWTFSSSYKLKEGEEIIEQNGSQFLKTIKIPKYAGFYMVKSVNNTDSMVIWNIKTDNLSETLEGSINLFLSKLKKESKK